MSKTHLTDCGVVEVDPDFEFAVEHEGGIVLSVVAHHGHKVVLLLDVTHRGVEHLRQNTKHVHLYWATSKTQNMYIYTGLYRKHKTCTSILGYIVNTKHVHLYWATS